MITNKTKEIYSYRKLFDYNGYTLYFYWDVDYALVFGLTVSKWCHQELEVDTVEEDFDMDLCDMEGLYDSENWDELLPIVDKILEDEKNKKYLDTVIKDMVQ